MKTGIDLIKHNILKSGFVFFEVQTPKGETLYAQMDEITPEEAIEEITSICEQLTPGRYFCLLSKQCDKSRSRIVKQQRGDGYFQLPLVIGGQNNHVDIQSHNAAALNPFQPREYRELLDKIKDLEKDILKLEIENDRLREDKENSGINGLLNNPGIQNIIAAMAANYMSKNPAQ